MGVVARRFDIFLVSLDPTIGREIRKTRPCVVISPDEMNRHLETVMVAPNALEKIYLPWVASLKGADADPCGDLIAPPASVAQQAGAFHLVASVPVTVYQFSALEYIGQGGAPGKDWSTCPGLQTCQTSFQANGCFSFTNDASLLLPSTAMTGNYRISSQADWPVRMLYSRSPHDCQTCSPQNSMT